MNFAEWRVDVVAEESSEAREELEELRSEHVRIHYVPADYETPGGTAAKARANCWLNALREQEGESRNDVWVLHMDDDTAIGLDTGEQVARFISGRGRADFDTDANPLHHGLTVVSRETRDYERTGVAIVSPWQS